MDYPSEINPPEETNLSILEGKKFEELVSEIKTLKKQTGVSFFEIGKRLKVIKDKELYSEKGIPTFVDFLKTPDIDFSNIVAERFILMVDDDKIKDSLYLGASKLTEILKLHPEHRNKLLSEPVDVDGRKKSLDELTLNELKRVSQDIKRTGKLKCDRCGRWVEHLKELDGKFYGVGSKHSCYDREVEDRRALEENAIPAAQFDNVLNELKETVKNGNGTPHAPTTMLSESLFQVYGQFLHQYKANTEEVTLDQLEKEEEMVGKLLHLLKNRLRDIKETVTLLREAEPTAV